MSVVCHNRLWLLCSKTTINNTEYILDLVDDCTFLRITLSRGRIIFLVTHAIERCHFLL